MKNQPIIKTTGRHKLQYRGVDCLNCGHPLDFSDKYCPNCSQANSTKKLTILDFFEEFFSNYFSYDSKLWQTLAALLLKPGKITREYIAGKRLSYTNPFRFLLSLSIVYFLIISFNSEFKSWNKFGSDNHMPVFNLQTQLNNLEFENEEEKNMALAQFDSLRIQSINGFKLSQSDSVLLANPKTHFIKINQVGVVGRFIEKIQFFNTVIKNDTLFSFEQSISKYDILETTENRMAFNLANSIVEIEKRPGTFLNSLISKLPIATFFFLPFFSFFVWMVYIRKKYTYTDILMPFVTCVIIIFNM
jgi:hypothetical protein